MPARLRRDKRRDPEIEGLMEFLTDGDWRKYPRIRERSFDHRFWCVELPAAWERLRDEIMTEWPRTSRPWGWWAFESGLDGGPLQTRLEIPRNQAAWLRQHGR